MWRFVGNTIRFLLIAFVFFIIAFFGYVQYQIYQASKWKTLDEQYDKMGRTVLKSEISYTCCEGFHERTIAYDTLGREIHEFGNIEGERYKKVWEYSDATLVFKGEYRFFDQETDTLKSDFNVSDVDLDFLSEKSYWPSGSPRGLMEMSWYMEDRDTLDLIHVDYDSSGNVLTTRMYKKERHHNWGDDFGEDTSYIEVAIWTHPLDNRIDTTGIKVVLNTPRD